MSKENLVDTKCVICGEESRGKYADSNNHYCSRHLTQLYKYGKILERTKFDDNEVVLKDNYYVMDLYNDKHEVVGTCLFDEDDYDLVMKHKWNQDRQGYAVTWHEGSRLSMHRLLLSPCEDSLTDHINHDKSDNRRFNLRIVNKSQNEANKPPRSDNTSGVKGVSKRRNRRCKWASGVTKGKKRVRKCFAKFDDAVKHRIQNEALIFGEYNYNHNEDRNTVQLLYHSHDDNKDTFIEVDMKGNITHFHKIVQ